MDAHKLSKALIALHDLVSKLRGTDGCPWDALQTDSTIRMYLLEEAYEVLDAIDSGDRHLLETGNGFPGARHPGNALPLAGCGSDYPKSLSADRSF